MPTQAQVHTKNIQSGHKVFRQFQEVITQKVAIKFFLHINILLLKLFVVGVTTFVAKMERVHLMPPGALLSHKQYLVDSYESR